MNPELPQVQPDFDRMPQIPGSAEYLPDGTVKQPEQLPNRHEQGVSSPEASQTAPAVGLPTLPTVQPVAQPVPTASDQDHILQDAPSIASDDDLIEKEWVDKVKKIIDITRGDPYEQAKAIALLQADYLKKRYNEGVEQTGG